MIRTGLLGGSFNPAHRGHRRLTIHASAELGLDEVWWLVSPETPLKADKGMAPLNARFASARRAARGLPIRVTAIERELGTRYTVDTLSALRRRFPEREFVWLMGADNLAQFTSGETGAKSRRRCRLRWSGRPGYDGAAHSARAMGWLRRFVRPAGQARHWTKWRPPALVLLKLPPDPTSATALRAADSDWHQKPAKPFNPKALRDGVTRRPLT
jgi:nicotinate-nucleotide adenylyltransferase